MGETSHYIQFRGPRGQAANRAATITSTSFVPEALRDHLLRNAQSRHVKAGERLFDHGDVGDGCYVLDKGLLKVLVRSPRGEERIIAILGPGTLVGELSMIDGQARSATVVALHDCALRFVSREVFQRWADSNPEFDRVLLKILAARLRQVDEALAATTFLSAKGRVARALLELARHLGQPSAPGHVVFREKISQADLAAMAGVARENVSRVFSAWRRRKVVDGTGRGYRLHLAALEREAYPWD